MRYAHKQHHAPLGSEFGLSSSGRKGLHPAAMDAHGRGAASQDRLLIKARHILDLVEQRDRHFFQHPLMADRAMGVMLSIFLAEFSSVSKGGAAPERAAPGQSQDKQDVIASLLDAGLIEAPVCNGEGKKLTLTPLGAGRMRSFISAYPEHA